jgi:hypothetical protein
VDIPRYRNWLGSAHVEPSWRELLSPTPQAVLLYK